MQTRPLTGLLAKLAAGPRAIADLARRGAGLARGPYEQKTLNAAAWSQTWPAPGATLDLDFANDRGFVRGVGQGRSMDAVTFTRASNGNWVDSAGVLRTGAGTFAGTANALGVNLLTFPQNFENAYWRKSNSTATVNTVSSPDETLTGNSFAETTANSFHLIDNNGVNATAYNATYTFSIYVKQGTRRYAVVYVMPNNSNTRYGVLVDLQTGSALNTYTLNSPTASNAITNAGNGYWRVAITILETNVSGAFIFTGVALSDSSSPTMTSTVYPTYQGDGTSGVFIWGAQLELGSSATTYYPTNINVPRFDWASTAVVAGNIAPNSDYPASWALSAISSTLNATTDPNGGNTGVLLTETASGTHYASVNVNLFAGKTYTVSAYFKNNSRQYAAIMSINFNNFTSNFDLVSPLAVSSNASASILDVGGGWYRCWMTFTANTTTTSLFIFGLNNSASGLGSQSYASQGLSLYVWGIQAIEGSAPANYQVTGAQVPTNTPLLPASTCNGLLIEESRANRILWCRDATSGTGTNQLTYSEQFNNAAWTKADATVIPDATTAPDSTNTADALFETATTAAHYVQQSMTLVNGTLSIYAKPNGRNWIVLQAVATTPVAADRRVWFNVSTGAVGTVGASWSNVSITSAGSGWYRVSGTFANISGQTSVLIATADADNSITYLGDVTKGLYLWGAQLLPGGVLTDYQATTSAALFGWSKATVTLAKNQTGVDNVANAATSITATAANGTLIQPISLASGSRTASVYLKRITGTGNVQVSLDGSTWSTVDLSSTEWRRIVLSGTVTNPVVGIRLATNGDAVAMDYAQVEDGAFATTPILTTTTSATRAIDTATIQGASFGVFYSAGATTIICNANIIGITGTQYLFGLAVSGSQQLDYRSNNNGFTWSISGVSPISGLSNNTLNKFAITFGNYYWANTANGTIISSNTAQGSWPYARFDSIKLMNGPTGYLNRFIYHPKTFNNTNGLFNLTSST